MKAYVVKGLWTRNFEIARHKTNYAYCQWITRGKMSTTNNSNIISLNLCFHNSQNRNVIFVIEVSKNNFVSVIVDRVRAILAPHLSVRPHNFHLQQIYPTSIQRRCMQPENMISVYFPENLDEDMIYIFVYPHLSPE
ncbi:hypothetical protein RclHR1_13460003 [Rhizophagus clarus]|uniref:Uncharacterized protein n=1 Tax=Rhizophagus clarus TaxID=94130 RepID=A0A2Z6QEJ1_9GLOM|nr:hypothetical protein RclHR1_13460003 [Rhizophagus clarus]